MFPSLPPLNNPFLDLHHHHQFSFKKSSSNLLSDFEYHQIDPASKQETLIVPLLNVPSDPFFDDNNLPLNQILSQSQIMAASSNPTDTLHSSPKKELISTISTTLTPNNNGVKAGPLRRRTLGAVPRRRAGKKDRHSKICTAQGIRDRRMRLSLQVARKFFDLQDMLGYDKASKTIEWLFNKSKKAIKDLSKDIHSPKSESFVSECEGLSGIEENSHVHGDIKTLGVDSPVNGVVKEERKPRKSTATCTKPNTMKESREKARARARCRTREKMMIKGMDTETPSSIQLWKTNPNLDQVPKLGFFFEGFDQESITSFNHDYHHQFEDVGTIEKLLQGSSSSSTNSSCPNNNNYPSAAAGVSGGIDGSMSNFMGFLGNWELLNGDRLSSTHYVADQVPLTESPNSNYSNFPLFH